MALLFDIPVTWNKIERNDGVIFSAPSTDNTINFPTSIFIHAPQAIPFANEQVNLIKNTLVNYYSSITNNFIERGFVNFPMPLTQDSHALVYALIYSYNLQNFGEIQALDVLIFEDTRFSAITYLTKNAQDFQNYFNILVQMINSYQPYISPDTIAPPVDQSQNPCDLVSDASDYFSQDLRKWCDLFS